MHYIHPDQEDVLEIAGAVEQARMERNAAEVPTISPTVNRGTDVIVSKVQ
jgi:hypothetical protein